MADYSLLLSDPWFICLWVCRACPARAIASLWPSVGVRKKNRQGAGRSGFLPPPSILLTGLIFFQCFWEACEARFLSCVFFNGFRLALARFPFFFFVRETGLSAPSSLARAFKLSLFFKFFKFFIFNKLCTRWSTRVSRVHCTFLSGLLYFFVGSIILFCRVYWTFLSGLLILLWFYKVYYGQR